MVWEIVLRPLLASRCTASRCSPSAPPFPRKQISYHSSTPLVMQNGESILLNNPCMSVTGGERAPFVFGEVIVDSEA